MWHFSNGEFEVHGDRQHIKEQLNIFVVGFEEGDEYYEEIANIWDDRHWRRIVEDYHLTGSDDTTDSI